MRVSRPVSVVLPSYGLRFAESVHASDFQMAERVDPFHKLVYVLAGKIEFRERGRVAGETVASGTLLIVPAGVPHAMADVEPSTLFLLCLSEGYLRSDPDLVELWGQLARLPDRRLHLSRPTRLRIEGMWRRAMLESAYAKLGGAVTARALAAQLLVLLARLPVRDLGNDALHRVKAVAREIEETFYDEWNLDRAAARSGLSRRRFSDLFRQTMGATFWDFLNGLRLRHAATLLRSEERSITGVMFACGFNDLSHFYRLFRRAYGVPPKQFVHSEAGRGN